MRITGKTILVGLLLVFSIVADVLATEVDATPSQTHDSDHLLVLEQLKSKISMLEFKIEEKIAELESKDDALVDIQKILEDKSQIIGLLHRQLESIQQKDAVDTKQLLEKVHDRSLTLEKQSKTSDEQKRRIQKTERLLKVAEEELMKAKSEAASKKKELAEIHGAWLPTWLATNFNYFLEFTTTEWNYHGKPALNALLQKASEMWSEAQKHVGPHLDTIRDSKTSDEQKRRIQKTERLLKVAEEELMKAKSEAASKKKELAEIHGAWLPTWLATNFNYFLEFTTTEWNYHGKPALNALLQKASEMWSEAQKHVGPHLDTIRDKWVPALKDQCASFSTFISPHVQQLSTKTVEVYKEALATVEPHVVNLQELANPYFQDAKKLSKPYIEQVTAFTKPHVQRARVILKAYTKKAVQADGKLLKSATTHYQVQAVAHENLKKYELTKALATKELVWFLASAFLALPMYFLYLMFASFWAKPKMFPSSSQTNHSHRRHKRRHAEN